MSGSQRGLKRAASEEDLLLDEGDASNPVTQPAIDSAPNTGVGLADKAIHRWKTSRNDDTA
uniref:Uncharacterized protein n=1 Tax=Leersia perrieri TaxID=77586 RepID=A0A0D9V1I3_9ORYZ